MLEGQGLFELSEAFAARNLASTLRESYTVAFAVSALHIKNYVQSA